MSDRVKMPVVFTGTVYPGSEGQLCCVLHKAEAGRGVPCLGPCLRACEGTEGKNVQQDPASPSVTRSCWSRGQTNTPAI